MKKTTKSLYKCQVNYTLQKTKNTKKSQYTFVSKRTFDNLSYDYITLYLITKEYIIDFL